MLRSIAMMAVAKVAEVILITGVVLVVIGRSLNQKLDPEYAW